MPFKLIQVKHHKRGATWSNGETRICSRCQIEDVRGRAAIVTAYLVLEGNESLKVPVSWCKEHVAWMKDNYGDSYLKEILARIVKAVNQA